MQKNRSKSTPKGKAPKGTSTPLFSTNGDGGPKSPQPDPGAGGAAQKPGSQTPLRVGFGFGSGIHPGNPVVIAITPHEHEVNRQAEIALGAHLDVYKRGGLLVRVVRSCGRKTRGLKRPMAPRIEQLPRSILEECLATNARFMDGEEGWVYPPGFTVAALHDRGEWPHVRHLEAVFDHPVFLENGKILCRPGYDYGSELFLSLPCKFPPVADRPTRDDSVRGSKELLEVVHDFPFRDKAGPSAWLASILTPLARMAIDGPAPLFLVDANVSGAGKGKLLNCTSIIVAGGPFTVGTYTNDRNELRKEILAIAVGGDRYVLFDNLEGRLGNGILDAALTATNWTGRILGHTKKVTAPLIAIFYATGNNVQLVGDTRRRTLPIHLLSPEEFPELRTGFRHPDLERWVTANRPCLLVAALTILRAWHVAGRPDMKLPAWGSYEEWSEVVRNAIVWAGMPDPADTRLELQDRGDEQREIMKALAVAWKKLTNPAEGITAKEAIDRYEKEPDHPPDGYQEFKKHLGSLMEKPSSTKLGNLLKKYHRTNLGGLFFIHGPNKAHGGAARWVVTGTLPATACTEQPSPSSPSSPTDTNEIEESDEERERLKGIWDTPA